ncbi:MAG: DNA protein, partial [Clostridiales bacterium]|nr:DNA protein [Clostridiales bacterium]
ENIKGREEANETHFEVGQKVRQTIKELGGTMPEDLETPKKSIKSIERAKDKKLMKK